MKAILLLSDGMDSPVAGHLLKKQGIELVGVNFNQNDKKALAKVKKLCKKIGIKKVYVFDHQKVLEEFIKNCDRRHTCILCKRFLYKIAEKVAKKEKIKYIVTGENLGQVASQTLDNLCILDNAVKLPVLRPLLGFDKVETMKIAREISTYDISSEKTSGCLFVPNSPVTKARLHFVEELERKVDIPKMLRESFKNFEVLNI